MSELQYNKRIIYMVVANPFQAMKFTFAAFTTVETLLHLAIVQRGPYPAVISADSMSP